MLQSEHPDNIDREQAWERLCVELNAHEWRGTVRSELRAFFCYGWDAKYRQERVERNQRMQARDSRAWTRWRISKGHTSDKRALR